MSIVARYVVKNSPRFPLSTSNPVYRNYVYYKISLLTINRYGCKTESTWESKGTSSVSTSLWIWCWTKRAKSILKPAGPIVSAVWCWRAETLLLSNRSWNKIIHYYAYPIHFYKIHSSSIKTNYDLCIYLVIVKSIKILRTTGRQRRLIASSLYQEPKHNIIHFLIRLVSFLFSLPKFLWKYIIKIIRFGGYTINIHIGLYIEMRLLILFIIIMFKTYRKHRKG